MSSLFGTPQPAQSGGLFGSTPAQPAQSGSLFGQPAAQSSGLFGSTQATTPSGSLFGSTPQPAQSGGLFGSTTPAQSTSLFGTTPQQPAQSGGLFGSTPQPAQSGSLFGSTPQQSATGGLFGSTPQPAQTGGLFGSTPQQPAQSGSLFGAQPQSQFGIQQQQPQQQQQIYQQQQQQQQQQQMQQAQQPWWERELNNVHAAYRPGPGSKFQAMLYEVVGVAPDLLCVPGAVPPAHTEHIKAQRKQQQQQQMPWIDQRDWQRAEERNPDPTNWVPSPLDGIKGLYDRATAQANNVKEQLSLVKQRRSTDNTTNGEAALSVSAWLDNLGSSDNFDALIDQCRHEHLRLTTRLIKVITRLERLQSRGSPVRQSEVEFARRIERLASLLQDPRGCRPTLNQIAAQLRVEGTNDGGGGQGQWQQQQQRGHSSMTSSDAAQDQQTAVFGLLESQREGLEHLIDVVQKDLRDVRIIRARMESAGASTA